MVRVAEVARTTGETDIRVRWDLDGSGRAEVATGIGFLDHMLTALARHSGTDIAVTCAGDLHIDGHHSTEDIGIALGQALHEALGSKSGIVRFGHMGVPLDEALVVATVDLSGRGHLVCRVHPKAPAIGDWDTELLPEFFQALAANGRLCIHLHQVCGDNSHHLVEATFKAFARALGAAIAVTGSDAVPSTKGILA